MDPPRARGRIASNHSSRSNQSKAGPGKLSNQPKAGPGKLSNQPKAGPGKLSNQPKAGPGKLSIQPKAGPGKLSNQPKAGPGKLSQDSTKRKAFTFVVQTLQVGSSHKTVILRQEAESSFHK